VAIVAGTLAFLRIGAIGVGAVSANPLCIRVRRAHVDERVRIGRDGFSQIKMPRKYSKRLSGSRCSICQHPNRGGTDLAIASHVTMKKIGERFGVSAHAAWRHGKHLGPELKAALALKLTVRQRDISAIVLEEGTTTIEQLRAVRAPLFSRFLACVDAGDDRAAAALAGRLHEGLQISAKLAGELVPAISTQIQNIVLSPDYIRLRSDLLAALRPFPEAAAAVTAVFRCAGEHAANEMRRTAPKMIEAQATEVCDAA
jgi:hypothetical protein